MRCHIYNAAGNRILWIDGGSVRFESGFEELKRAGSNLARQCQCAQEMTAILYRTASGSRAVFWNPDGTEEELCGNAIRCLPHFISDGADLIDDICIETSRGIYVGRRLDENHGSVVIPAFTIRIQPKQSNGDSLVNTGSPHCIRVVEHEWPKKVVKEAIARSRGADPVNFDLVRVVNPFHFRARVFERGVGETFSCGTGAAAIVAALGTFDRSPGKPHLVEFASGEQLTVTHHPSPDAFEVGGRVELLMAASVAIES